MRKVIVLDAGHGGLDPGAVGPSGLQECDVVLDVARRLRILLEPHYIVVMTPDQHHGMSLAERARISNDARPHLFLSIHCNSHQDRRAHGFEVWTSPGSTKADDAATALWRAYRRAFPGLTGRLDMVDGDVDKEARFYVLVRTADPAVLFELAFISNPSEEILLGSGPWRQRAAAALHRGLVAYLGEPA